MQVYVKYISGFDLCNLLLFCRLDYSSIEDEGKTWWKGGIYLKVYQCMFTMSLILHGIQNCPVCLNLYYTIIITTTDHRVVFPSLA